MEIETGAPDDRGQHTRGRNWHQRWTAVAVAAGMAGAALFALVGRTLGVAPYDRLAASGKAAALPVPNASAPLVVDWEAQWCTNTMKHADEMYARKLDRYQNVCGITDDDVVEEGGKFRIVGFAKLCKPICQDSPELHRALLPDYPMLEKQCAGRDGLEKVKAVDNLLQAFDSAWSSCAHPSKDASGAAAAPAAATGAFDFTAFLAAFYSPPRFLELYNPRDRYQCCCRPDFERKSVQCKLVMPRHAHSAHRRRYASQRTDHCPAGLHPWNTTGPEYWLSAPPEASPPGTTPGALVGSGRCVIEISMLPNSLSSQSHNQINASLVKALRIAWSNGELNTYPPILGDVTEETAQF